MNCYLTLKTDFEMSLNLKLFENRNNNYDENYVFGDKNYYGVLKITELGNQKIENIEQFLQIILQVIGQKSQTAGGQGWQRRLPRQFQGPQQVFQDLERIAPANLEAPVPLQTDPFTLAAQHQEWVPTHNGIAGAVQVAAAQQQHGVSRWR